MVKKRQEKFCFFNGKIVEQSALYISPHDLGLIRGYAVFDYMTAPNDKPFLIKDHWLRLNRSAKMLALKVPMKFETYEKIVGTLLEKNGLESSAIRSLLTGGVSTDGITTDKPSFLIMVEPYRYLPSLLYEKGAKLITVEHARGIPEAKSTNYIEALRNQKKRARARATEILYIKNNKVLEATTSNIFIVKNKIVITPNEDVLAGITRKIVIRLAKKDFLVKERSISVKELAEADEIFITATGKHVLPVTSIAGIKIKAKKVGPVTRKIMERYNDLYLNY
jgi:branched-chain amino acid aminotransferase